MDALLKLVVSNPLADIQIVLSIGGALGFIIFAWGFSGFILAHEDAEHQVMGTKRMIIGLSWMLTLFILWEVVRWLGTTGYLVIALVGAAFLGLLYLLFLLK